MRAVAERIGPDSITLVPERREERTTEGGLDVKNGAAAIGAIAKVCERAGTKLALFIEPDLDTVRRSRGLGARQVELHTGRYALCSGAERDRELERLREAAALGSELGLDVAAGHALTSHNVLDVAAIAAISEVNIGHALVSDAVFLGLGGAVLRMRAALERGDRQRAPR
jgi:pyridoxine 5-phosphate synthase